jgi:flagellar basal-body rod modification protein FlgD
MVGTVTATTDNSSTQAAMKKSMGMNKDDFMKLFIAQLKYQDPMKPQDPSAMLDQLSQLSLVEQSYNSNTALNNLLAAQNNSISLTAVSFIGKNVKANGNAASFDGSTPSPIEFTLSLPTAATELTISDASGKVVRSDSLGASKAGDKLYYWDGKDSSGTLLNPGAYTFAIRAIDASGKVLPVTTFTAGKVDGVDLSGSSPLLSIGATTVSLSDVKSIETGG